MTSTRKTTHKHDQHKSVRHCVEFTSKSKISFTDIDFFISFSSSMTRGTSKAAETSITISVSGSEEFQFFKPFHARFFWYVE